ncbi:hypothetical protein KPL71_000412 [Citrus sinensis]|uniref:Uncharacterized protein n=1 Tax=Citrus sinensis TaxID=2711 RepID=A0ACB8NPE4_CITSI|nr:hypothetical protein KPL71_000412 [Citrus sinensis]
MATESKASVGKVKSSNQASSSKGKPDSSSLNKKKIDSSIKQPPKSSSALTKTEREPLRIFYESLSKQIPTSEMAEFWMMEHGLLSPERAKKAYEKKQRKQKQVRMGTPNKSPHPLSNKPESSQKQQQGSKNGDIKAKRRVSNDADDDDDFILSPKRRKGREHVVLELIFLIGFSQGFGLVHQPRTEQARPTRLDENFESMIGLKIVLALWQRTQRPNHGTRILSSH